MSNESTLRNAIREELETAHGLDPETAARRAGELEPGVRSRFAKWVRRELLLTTRATVSAKVAKEAPLPPGIPDRAFERLSINVRLQHALMALSVVVLVITGLPLKFHESGWARWIIASLGGPDVTPLIHRGAATGLIVVGLWHLFYIVVLREGRQNFRLLIPGPKDAVDAWQNIRYYLGRVDRRPRFDKFSYIEKFDYWAVYWGMIVMIGSGLVLWFTDFFLRYFPKWATDIAKEAHSDEALLATLAIVIWHFYNVHFNPHNFPMNRTFITGKISARDMIEEHPLEYERITGQPAPDLHHPAPQDGGEK